MIEKECLPMHAALFLGGGDMTETVVGGNNGVITAHDDALDGRWLDLGNVHRNKPTLTYYFIFLQTNI